MRSLPDDVATTAGVATLPIGAFPDSDPEPIGLVCNEVWGGNRAFFGPVKLPGIRGVLFSQASDGTRGGDLHYLSVCGSGLISRACLADVTGHGESVAAISQAMHDLLRRSMNRLDERRVLRRMNLRLPALNRDGFVTAAAITYFPPTRRLSISSAGHEPPWYYDAARREWSAIETSPRQGLYDMPLGVVPRTRYTRRVRRAAPGDRLLLLTDGVVEAPSESGELFGRERLAQVLRAGSLRSDGHPSLEGTIRTVVAALRAHTNHAPLNHDDVSLLLVEFVDLERNMLWTMLRNRLRLGRRDR